MSVFVVASGRAPPVLEPVSVPFRGVARPGGEAGEAACVGIRAGMTVWMPCGVSQAQKHRYHKLGRQAYLRSWVLS